MWYCTISLIICGFLMKFSYGGYCTYSRACSKYTHRHCGTWGWGRCGYTRYYTCYYRACCEGYRGHGCTTPICSSPCRNGGTCISPNICSCTIYYTGSICQTKKSCQDKQMELFFLLDSSGSIGQDHFGIVKEFVQNVSQELDIGQSKTRVGLMTFSRYPVIRMSIANTGNKSKVLADIERVPYHPGMTETHTALRLLQQEGFYGSRTNVPHVAILITEGKSIHSNETSAAALSINQHGIQVFVVGIGQAISSTELHKIATDPDSKHLITVKKYSALPDILEKLTTLTCDVSAHTYTPLTTPKPVIIKYARPEPIQECNGKAADIMFVLDSTNTIGQAHFKSVKHFALNIVNDFDVADNASRIGIMTFSTYPMLRLQPGKIDDKLQLLNYINNLVYYAGTRETDRALELLRNEVSSNYRDVTPNIAILITDGSSTNSFLTMRAADELKQSGVEVFVVEVGEKANVKELEYISSDRKSNVFLVSNYEELDLSSFEGIVARTICKDIPILTTQSTTPSTSSTTMTATMSSMSLSTTLDFVRSNTSDCVPEVKDIMFLIDSSSRIGGQHFLKMKTFVKQTIGSFNIGMNVTRVGLTLFSTNATLIFSLNQYNTSEDIIKAIDDIQYQPDGEKNTGEALAFIRRQGFTYDRKDVPNIAFLISDGYSTDKMATKEQASLAKQNNTIQIVTVAVGKSLDFDELVDIASTNPYTNRSLIYHADDFDDLHLISLEHAFASVVCGLEQTSSTTTVAISTGNSLSVAHPCFDKVTNCDEYRIDMCDNYRPWAMGHCQQFCGFCQGTTTAAKSCKDQIGNCNEYGSSICNSSAFTKWTKDHCQKFCGLCGEHTSTVQTRSTAPSQSAISTTTTTPQISDATQLIMLNVTVNGTDSFSHNCKDKIENCDEFGNDICTDYVPWAKAHCEQYCGFCQGSSTTHKPCMDTIGNCDEYGTDMCTSLTFFKWTQDHCARFCNLCVPDKEIHPEGTCPLGGDEACRVTANGQVPEGRISYPVLIAPVCSKVLMKCATQPTPTSTSLSRPQHFTKYKN